MWKTSWLLSLIIFTIDSPRDRLTRAEPIRLDAGLVIQRNDYQDKRIDEPRRRVFHEDDENSSGLYGKWRSNGEALEPKWRDGDAVPLLPFSHFPEHTGDELDTTLDEIRYQTRQGLKYRQNNAREGYTQPRIKQRVPHLDDYEEQEPIKDGYQERETGSQRGNNRVPAGAGGSFFIENSGGLENRNRDAMSAGYREAFQARPNEYEQELNDEEYLKPRPRKRRPPQNYEFALAVNEAELRGYKRVNESSRPWSRTGSKGNAGFSASEPRNNTELSKNAVELKSLLKMQQEEGLSLSELLQRRNLTLSDLLKGKADVISALRTKDLDETEYTEETSKELFSSIEKVPAENPRWTINAEIEKVMTTEKYNGMLTSTVTSNKKEPAIEMTTTISSKNSTDTGGISLSDKDRLKAPLVENSVIGKPIFITLDPLPTNVMTSTRMSTVFTTSTPPQVATNSIELIQGDDANLKSEDSHEMRSENFDEDEIMEFSDFTEFKKGKNNAAPIWLTVKDEETTALSGLTFGNAPRDSGSTLSIEQILQPTERVTNARNSSSVSEVIKIMPDSSDRKGDKSLWEKEQSILIERPIEDYSIIEHEYQDDIPVISNDEHTTENSDAENEDQLSVKAIEEMKETLNNYEPASKEAPNERKHGESLYQQNTVTKEKQYDEIISEIEPEARAEIFELFASSSAGKRLERLLKSRNMSIEELIALRQRGSSKVHLAEVSRLKVQKSNISHHLEDEVSTHRTEGGNIESGNGSLYQPISHGNEDTSKRYESLPKIQPGDDSVSGSTNTPRLFEDTVKSISTEHIVINNKQHSTTVKSRETIESSQQESEEENTRRTIEIVDLLTTFASLPFAKDIQLDFTDEIKNYDGSIKSSVSTENISVSENEPSVIKTNESQNIIQSGHVEEVIKQEPSSIDVRTVFRENDVTKEDNKIEGRRNLARVKPSIIASGAILGVTIVVFLAIFLTCRIRQKQKYRYRNTFSRAVFQGPVMAARKLSNSSSLSTVMVNVVTTSTTRRSERKEHQEGNGAFDPKSDIDNDSLDANDSWETIPDYMKQ